MSLLTLVCLLEGGQHIFVVSEPTDNYVCELKNTIKKANENRLRDVDSPDLTLWKVRDSSISKPRCLPLKLQNSLQVNVNLEGVSRDSYRDIKVEGCQEAELLWPLKALSQVFPDPPARTQLSIIVRPDGEH